MAILIIIAIIITLIYFKLIKPFIILSKLNLDMINLITGAPKTGKSSLAIYIALTNHYNNVKIEKIKNFFRKIFKKPQKELPLLYSNIPIYNKYGYVPITTELLTRRERFADNSTVYMGEFSLIADSMDYKNEILNEQLNLLIKLWGHSSHNSKLVIDTQNISDLHFGIKKNINKYIFIDKKKKSIFNLKLNIREMAYNYENNGINNNFNKKTIEEETNQIMIPKSIWKAFDYECYKVLIEDKPINKNVIKKEDIKKLTQDKIVTLKTFKTINLEKKEQINNGKQTK